MASGGGPDDKIFEPGHLRSAYQPVVDLVADTVVGAEAFARWPRLPVTPGEAFRHARLTGRAHDLDILCQRAAVAGVGAAGLPGGFDLFVNLEPGVALDVLVDGDHSLEVVADLSAAGLDVDPSGLLDHAARLREGGLGVALGDVDASEGTLAFLPFVAPDVVKVNLARLTRWPAARCGRLLDAVAGYASRTGATVLAEGIETEAQANAAVRFGATLGQGWWFGRPGPLPEEVSAVAPALVTPAADRLARQRRALLERSTWGGAGPDADRSHSTLTERLVQALGSSA